MVRKLREESARAAWRRVGDRLLRVGQRRRHTQLIMAIDQLCDALEGADVEIIAPTSWSSAMDASSDAS